ncbi:MAG: PASTA domain-containing protein [Clostridia bacterium]|nr:PASTA domain-containing protein [Clostridia bacterium]
MIEEVKVPNVQGISIKDAQKVVKELGLELSIENEAEDLDKENTIIVDQTPKEGIVVNKGNKIYVKY